MGTSVPVSAAREGRTLIQLSLIQFHVNAYIPDAVQLSHLWVVMHAVPERHDEAVAKGNYLSLPYSLYSLFSVSKLELSPGGDGVVQPCMCGSQRSPGCHARCKFTKYIMHVL